MGQHEGGLSMPSAGGPRPPGLVLASSSDELSFQPSARLVNFTIHPHHSQLFFE